MKKKLEECKICKGTGEYKDSADDMFGNTITFYNPCEYCEGEGKVEKGNNLSWLK